MGERDVITHVKCFLRVDDTPLLEAVAELPPPDPEAFDEYWRDTDNPLWAEMQDPSGFERPEYVMRDKLAPWAWSVLDRDALEAEGLAKWRAILAGRTKPVSTDDLVARLAALEKQLAAKPAPEAAPPPSPVVVALEGMEALRAKIDGVRKTGSIDTSGVDDLEPLTPDDLINMVADNPPGSAAELENTVRVIRGEARRRFTELLNVELSGLEQERAVGSAHANPKREQQIEYLLGLFARLGEI